MSAWATSVCSPETAHGLLVVMADGSSNNHYITNHAQSILEKYLHILWLSVSQINTFLQDVLVIWLSQSIAGM